MSEEKTRLEKAEEIRALEKLTKFLTVPHGISEDTKEKVDIQADLSSNQIARGLFYHRNIADRFRMMLGDDKNPGLLDKKDVEMIDKFGNRLSLLTWAIHRKSREEAVVLGHGLRQEKSRLKIESLETIDVKPPEGEKRRRLL